LAAIATHPSVPSSHAGTSAFRVSWDPLTQAYSRTMTAEGVALILGAVATLVTALSTAIVLILRRDVRKVHTLVNQNRTDMLQYQNDLIMVLQANKIIVPRDRSTDAVP
jgi:hypothetical protein